MPAANDDLRTLAYRIGIVGKAVVFTPGMLIFRGFTRQVCTSRRSDTQLAVRSLKREVEARGGICRCSRRFRTTLLELSPRVQT
jgi:hypothetical protein